jgi:hypothetical protein
MFAGAFYPASPKELKSMIQRMVDEKAEKKDVIGYYTPHAGYEYSGRVAGATVSRIIPKDTFIIMGPNHTGLGASFSIMTEGTWKTPLGEVEIDSTLAKKILAGSEYLEEDFLAHSREHSIEVQLPFIQYFKSDFKIVPIVLQDAQVDVYRNIAHSIAKAIKESGKEVVIVASGDMTHYESQKMAKTKDAKAVESMVKLEAKELLARVHEFHITMCGYATASVLIFAAKELGADKAELVKYKTSGDATGDMSSVVGYAGVIFFEKKESPQVKLARETIESYIKTGVAPRPELVPAEMQVKAGAFVSIHKGKELRGCIGTIEPQEDNVAQEIVRNAVSAAVADPRFDPITPDELPQLNYSVDILTEPVPVEDMKKLNPKKQGLIVESGQRRGLLLPDLEGVETVEYQYQICCAKAGISPEEKTKQYCFEVKRYK